MRRARHRLIRNGAVVNRGDVVRHALGVLDQYGLADLSMRRLAADLGVQPSALYWHVPNKQTLLAAVADEVLRDMTLPEPTGEWRSDALDAAHALRTTLLAHRDGAELVATAYALGMGEVSPAAGLVGAFGDRSDAVEALLYFILGFVQAEQLRGEAVRHGATSSGVANGAFDAGLALILAGAAAFASA